MTCGELLVLHDRIDEEIREHAHSMPQIGISYKEDEEAYRVSFDSSLAELGEYAEKEIQLKKRRLEVLREYQRRCIPQP